MEKIKTAIIGVGDWGKKLAKNLNEHTDLSRIVHNNSPETIKWLGENLPKIPHSADLNSVLNDPSIKAVVIATPIPTHFDIALRTLQAGKNIFLEKPGTDSSKKLSLLIDEATSRDLITQIGYEFTYSPAFGAIKTKIGSDRVKSISFTWRKWGSFKSHPVINLLVHELSMLKFLGMNDIRILKCDETDGTHHPDSIDVEALCDTTKAHFHIDRTSLEKEKTVVIETEKEKLVWKDTGENLIGAEIEAFASSVQTGKKPFTDGKFAKEILEIIETIPYHS